MSRLIVLLIVTLMLFACVRTPTHDTQIVDDRPRVSFNVENLQQENNYLVRVDGIDYGAVTQYLQNKNTLPLLPGQHTIEIVTGGDVVFRKKVYLGENTSRVIKVVDYE